ncbi:hypothetical protein D3C86_1645970 [compost metagenome]
MAVEFFLNFCNQNLLIQHRGCDPLGRFRQPVRHGFNSIEDQTANTRSNAARQCLANQSTRQRPREFHDEATIGTGPELLRHAGIISRLAPKQICRAGTDAK